MNTTKALKLILVNKDLNQQTLAKRMGLSKQSLNVRINRGNPVISKFDDTLNYLDYKIVVMPANAALSKDSYEIDNFTPEKKVCEDKAEEQ